MVPLWLRIERGRYPAAAEHATTERLAWQGAGNWRSLSRERAGALGEAGWLRG
jgi:hypothetical protein